MPLKVKNSRIVGSNDSKVDEISDKEFKTNYENEH
jgi:hypothetical protein